MTLRRLFIPFALLLLLLPSCSNEKPTPNVAVASATGTSDTTDTVKSSEPGAMSDSKRSMQALMESFSPLKTPLDAKLKALLKAQKWDEAKPLLATLKTDPAKEPWLTFLKAYVDLQTKSYATCLSMAKAAAPHLEVLEQDAYFVGAECARELKKWDDAALLAAKVKSTHVLYERALFLLGEVLYVIAISEKSKRDKNVTKTLRHYLKMYPKGDRADQARMMLGRTLEIQGEPDEAALIFNEFILRSPLSDDVPDALAGLARLQKRISASTKRTIAATEREKTFNKLEEMFSRHRSKLVVSQGEEFLEELLPKKKKRGKKASTLDPQTRKIQCQVAYMIARSVSKLRDHPKSVSKYKRAIAVCPKGKTQMKAYYMLGKGLWNAGDRVAAKKSFQTLWENYGDQSYADDAMLYAARISFAQGDQKKGNALLNRQLDRYPNGDMAKDARWLKVRGMLDKKDHKAVVRYVESLEDPGEHDLYTQGRLAYFRARSLEALGKKTKANKTYRTIAKENVIGYYAMLSLNRIALLEGLVTKKTEDLCTLKKGTFCDFLNPPPSQGKASVEVPKELAKSKALRRGAIFLSLGLLVPAEREFQKLRRAFARQPEALWALATLLDAAGSYYVSHDIPRRLIKGWQTAYPVGEYAEKWLVAYPNPFTELVEKWAKARDIAPAMVWGIMREESGFNPEVESWANARGLIQLMEGTAKGQARKDGLKTFQTEDLFIPEVNIRLGTSYIQELGESFGGHPALMIAGYNGGAGNVNKWLRTFGDLELDFFVEKIPYGQTRKYTKRVLTSYWAYSWLYRQKRGPVLRFGLK